MTMEQLIVAVVALPLVSAALIQLFAPALGRRVARLSVAVVSLTFVLAAALLTTSIVGGESGQIALGGSWGILLFDPLSALMATVIAGISLIVHIYSVRYMAEEAGYARFFVMLDLMTATLLAMVSAGDLITLLIAWHLVGFLLYFLLGHDNRSQTAHRYAFWTLITCRPGDR